jgi:hypothetical protein
MEIRRPLYVDTWKACVTLGLLRLTTPDDPPVSIAGSGKSVVWFAFLRLIPLM